MSGGRAAHVGARDRDEAVRLLCGLIALPYIAPVHGGPGEWPRARYVLDALAAVGIRASVYAYTDLTGTERPNVVALLGSGTRRLWFITHLDALAPSGWTSDPFTPRVEGDRVIGCGSSDNGQAVVASLVALRRLSRHGIAHDIAIGFAFVADQDGGSVYGAESLVSAGIFDQSDYVVVLDGGSTDGDELEVAEKSVLVAHVDATGTREHTGMGTVRANALDALLGAAVHLLNMLRTRFGVEDADFHPATSTFEPTIITVDGAAFNMIPERASLTIDCRLLPRHPIAKVKEAILSWCVQVPRMAARVGMELDAGPSSRGAPVVGLLADVLCDRGVRPRQVGVGGGTVAAVFRRSGIPAVAWSTVDAVEGQPEEYCRVSNLMRDADTIAAVCRAFGMAQG